MRADDSVSARGRVLFFSSVGELGGGESCMLRLIAALRRKGWRPMLACPDRSPLAEAARQMGVALAAVSAPAFFDEGVFDELTLESSNAVYGAMARRRTLMNYGRALPAALQLAQLIRKSEINLVHSNSPRSATMAGLAARLTGRPSITHVRDIFHTPFANRFKRGLLDAFTNVYLAASRATADVMPTRRPVVVAYDGLDPFVLEYCPGMTNPRRGEIGMAALMTPWKGHDVFIRAAIRLAATRPEHRFSILGGDLGWKPLVIYRRKLEQMISDAGMTDRIRLVGHSGRMLEWMSGLDVFVHPPTHPDPFPGVVLEACAAACPIVATRTGGIPEIVTDLESAILVPPGDDIALAHGIGLLLDDRTMAQRLGAEAQRSVRRFTMDETVTVVDALYSRILAGHVH